MTAGFKRRHVLGTTCILLVQRHLVSECYMSHQRPPSRRAPGGETYSSYKSLDGTLFGIATNKRGKLQRKSPLIRNEGIPAPEILQTKSAEITGIRWKTISGILVGTFIIFGLAGTSTDPDSSDPLLRMLPIGTVNNVIDATLPSSSTDFVAVSLGEAIAGTIGASLSAVLRALSSKDRKPLVAEALADSDFFITQAGLAPTLEVLGISPLIAKISSVVVATVPSSLVKLSSQQKQRLLEEERSLLELLEEERKRQESPKGIRERAKAMRRIRPEKKAIGVDPATLMPISVTQVDFVEIFSDVTRWLGYNALMSDYGEAALWSGAPADPGVTGAVLGFIAAFSSRLYADLLYGVLRYGPEAKQKEVLTRSTPDWVTYYASTSISAAILFGVYEASQGPISRWIQGTLAGGFDGCIGSESFETCFDTYIQANAPEPTPEAQVRALVTNLIMVGQRVQDVAADTAPEDIERLLRAWTVSANSYLNSLF